MRGKRILLDLLLDKKKPLHQPLTRKGRNEALIICRDECLAARFYYYTAIQCLDYPKTMNALSKQFFISEIQVQQRLMGQQEYIKELKEKKASIKVLSKLFPWLNWE